MRKPAFGVVQRKIARGLKFRIEEVDGLYYLCSESTVPVFAYA